MYFRNISKVHLKHRGLNLLRVHRKIKCKTFYRGSWVGTPQQSDVFMASRHAAKNPIKHKPTEPKWNWQLQSCCWMSTTQTHT